MRVLFVMRPSAGVRSGGDLTQALFTKRALQRHGVEVDVAPSLEPDARGYDTAHIFGVFDPEVCAVQMAACKTAGVPVALSPIWWDLFGFYGRSRACERILAGRQSRVQQRLARLRCTKLERLLSRNERRKYRKRLELQTRLMRSADVLMPNSEIEAYQYRHHLGLHDRPIVVVRHANDVPLDGAAAAGKRRGVLCVGRIEPKKNQAMLLYALAGLNVELTLMGACFEPQYMKLCERWALPGVRFTGEASREDVVKTMAGSAVHVLAGWAETPGIASIEAATAGARVVVSSDGTESEYFGEDALYVDPANPQSIRAAVEKALAMPSRERPDSLDRRIGELTGDAVARQTLRGYELAAVANG